MTETEKLRIHKLRQEGLGYKKIAAALDLPVNSVKTHLRRHPAGKDGGYRSRYLRKVREAYPPGAPPKAKTVLLGLMPHLLVERQPQQRREAYTPHLYLCLLRTFVSERCERPVLLLPRLLCSSSEKGGERRWMICISV